MTIDAAYFRINNILYSRGLTSLILLEKSIKSTPLGIDFGIASPFADTLKNLLLHATAGGFIERWFAQWFNLKNKRKEDQIGPQVLTLEHLEIGFIACAIPLSLSVIVFLVELSVERLKKLLSCFLSYLVAPFVVVSFISSR